MATFIDLDSTYRDRQQYPNPAEFVVGKDQLINWFRQARTVRAFPQQVSQRQMEMVDTIKLIHLVVPYQADIMDVPIIFVEFTSQKYKDKSLVSTMNNNHPTIKFICEWDKVQNDSAGDPAWIHYKTNMSQVMRFSRDFPIYFKLTFTTGNVLDITDTVVPEPINPAVQIHATFEVIPYIRDDEFSNHIVDTIV